MKHLHKIKRSDFKDQLPFTIKYTEAQGESKKRHFHPHLVDIFLPSTHNSQVPRVLSLPFLWPKSNADTLNAMNDIDLNL